MIENYSWTYLLDKPATPIYKTIGDLVTQEEGKSILDIGCGYSRWNEFYNGNATIVGYDNNVEAISYCKDHYPNHTWFIEDCWTYRFKEQFDIIILSGILYYCKNDNIFSPLQYVSQLIDDHKPKIIIVQEPMPNVFYKSPDFLPLFDKYAYEIFYHELDIRMGRRCVYKFYVDQIRPYVSKSFYSFGTDGYGRSDGRKKLRSFFEVDKEYIVTYTLSALAKEKLIPSKYAEKAMKKYNINKNKLIPTKL